MEYTRLSRLIATERFEARRLGHRSYAKVVVAWSQAPPGVELIEIQFDQCWHCSCHLATALKAKTNFWLGLATELYSTSRPAIPMKQSHHQAAGSNT